MNNFAEPSATTTTRTTVTETKVNLAIRWDPSYIKTIPGMLKIGAVVGQVSTVICQSLKCLLHDFDLFLSKIQL